MCAVSAEQDHPDVHEDSLHQFHVRLGHLSYAAIEELAPKPESGIKLVNHDKPQCISCAEGKQTRNNQSKKDSGNNAPIDRIGGVICSDLKVPITPTDRSGNRYMISFIDYNTNYCRVFLAKTKDQSAKKFEHFLAWFERRFDCRVQVFRTDGGLEYRNIDPFCQKTGVARQLTEPNSPAFNGKAERMYRTILNMARCMIFYCGLSIRRRQAGRLWNNLLHAQLIDISYTRCKTDLYLYFRCKERDIAIVGVYVDDLLATATRPQLVEVLFTSLQTLEVKDLGVVRKFLGMRIEFKPDGFTLDQETLVREYVEAHSLANATP